MNFGQAIEVLKEGKAVARKDWHFNSSRIYLNLGVINAAYVVEEESGSDEPLEFIDGVSKNLFMPHAGDVSTVMPSICLKNDACILQGWYPQPYDILAEDWEIFQIAE